MPECLTIARARDLFSLSRQRGNLHPLLLLSLLIAALVALPILGVLSNLFVVDNVEAQTFTHLWQTVLPEYIVNSMMLLWLGGAVFLFFLPVFATGAIWLYVLVFVFTGLWFQHYALQALATYRVEHGDAGPKDVVPLLDLDVTEPSNPPGASHPSV